MDKTKKIWLVMLIVMFTCANYILLTMLSPVIQSMVGVAIADPVLSGPAAGNFTAYNNVLKAIPFYLYIIPAVVGVIEAVIVLRTGEKVFNRGQG